MKADRRASAFVCSVFAQIRRALSITMCAFVFLGLSAAPLCAFGRVEEEKGGKAASPPILEYKTEISQGELGLIRVRSLVPMEAPAAVIRRVSGSVNDAEAESDDAEADGQSVEKSVFSAHTAKGSAGGEGADYFCFFPVPLDAAPGAYVARLEFRLDNEALSAEAAFAVVERVVPVDEIALDRKLSALRAKPSARKAEEARLFERILASASEGPAYVDASFSWPVAEHRLTSTYGDLRRYLYADGSAASARHWGLDLAAKTGTPVSACARALVVYTGNWEIYGNVVILEHARELFSIYAHLDSIDVAALSVVEAGEQVGTVGSTGLATGPHLHWELRYRSRAADPESLVGHPALGGASDAQSQP